jgi:hypothetical protein
MALCLLGLLAPAAANAQDDGPVAPADAAVVAGPLASGATLVAFDRNGELCVALRGEHSSCGPALQDSAQPQVEITANGGAAWSTGP